MLLEKYSSSHGSEGPWKNTIEKIQPEVPSEYNFEKKKYKYGSYNNILKNILVSGFEGPPKFSTFMALKVEKY